MYAEPRGGFYTSTMATGDHARSDEFASRNRSHMRWHDSRMFRCKFCSGQVLRCAARQVNQFCVDQFLRDCEAKTEARVHVIAEMFGTASSPGCVSKCQSFMLLGVCTVHCACSLLTFSCCVSARHEHNMRISCAMRREPPFNMQFAHCVQPAVARAYRQLPCWTAILYVSHIS